MGIVVSGHEGFIGSYLMEHLPPDTVGLDIKSGNDILNCPLPEADTVIHLAAEPGVIASMEDPCKNAQTNILGTIRLANHYKDSKFIFASSGGTIQETIESPYGLSKKTCEEYIKLLMRHWVILRFPNVYGEGSRSVVDKFLNQDRNIVYGDGGQTRTYGHVSDVVRGVVKALDWPEQQTYKFGGKQNYTVKEIGEAIGRPLTYLMTRPGELAYSRLDNITPDWETTVELMDYIKDAKNGKTDRN